MGVFRASLLTVALLCAVSSFAFAWGDFEAAKAEAVFAPEEIILSPSLTDDPQPDTILYDDNAGNWLAHGVFNFWADVKFTAPVAFELRSVYIYPNNANNNTVNNLEVTITTDANGNPGATLATIIVPAPIGQSWIDANVNPALNFTAGQHFHIYYNIPGGTYPTDPGWWPRYDAGTTTNRSKLSVNRVTWDPWNSDCFIRAGGLLGGGFLDLATVCVYNTSGLFFMTPGAHITFRAEVENLGMVAAQNYSYTWVARDTSGVEVWRYSNFYTSLAGGASVTLTADSAFTAATEGYYYVWGTAFHPDDADHSNDTQGLEQGIDSLGVWYVYDDGAGESQFTMDPGDGFGNSFTPAVYPCDVDSVAVMIGDSAQCIIKVYQNNLTGGTPTTVLWSQTATLRANQWGVFAPFVTIFEGSFTVAVEAVTATTMKLDDGVPNAAGNPNMPASAWNLGVGWSPFEGSDPMARAYVSLSGATPPYPVIAVSTDTINFAATIPGDTSRQNLTIYNTGGDTLVLIAAAVSPTPPFNLSRNLTGVTIPSGDSVMVDVLFFPPDSGSFMGTIVLLNNSSVSPYLVRMFGVGSYSARNLNVTLTPFSPPVIIPPDGGNFRFNASIQNLSPSQANFDAWTMARLPNGGLYGPILLRTFLPIPGNATIARDLNQNVPANAPSGFYYLLGLVGTYPNEVVDSDSFQFVKMSGEASPAHNQGWACSGWDDYGEITNQSSQIVHFNSSPNPFNSSTIISFELQAASSMKLAVYDIAGREIAVLAEGWYPAGHHLVHFDANDLSSGIYFVRLEEGNFTQTRKLLLVK